MKPNLPVSPLTTILALALFAFAATARAGVEDKITKSYEVAPGGQLSVEVDRGSIVVRTADRKSVGIEVIRKAGGNEAKAENVLKAHIVTTTQDGSKVEVRASYTGPSGSGWLGRSPDLQVSYVLTIPKEFDVNLKTAGGNIKVAELTGKTHVRTSGGNLALENLAGPVSARTSGGDIRLIGCQGAVDLGTSGGKLNLSDIKGELTAKTSGGSIHANKLAGKAVLKTSGGSIEAADIKGSIEAVTTGGNIDVSLLEQPSGDCSFKTSGGNATVALGEKVAVDVDLHTSGGRVATEFPVVTVIYGEQAQHQIRGKVNGGGPLVTAHTSGGNVRLLKN